MYTRPYGHDVDGTALHAPPAALLRTRRREQQQRPPSGGDAGESSLAVASSGGTRKTSALGTVAPRPVTPKTTSTHVTPFRIRISQAGVAPLQSLQRPGRVSCEELVFLKESFRLQLKDLAGLESESM
ncbi:unnamed protein product [Nezara viridula]|uniref:Uncharacterized protein n=1 Tax=Nezara viridula TaxID=85310 RepID=A0A9P0E524_NEZVI|nr:unnamed protein product [Nezara viridula]